MKKVGWILITIILLIATVIDIFIPDPLPFVDEVLLIAGTIWTGLKMFK